MMTSIRKVPSDLAMSALLIMVNYFKEIDITLENLGVEWDNLLKSRGCSMVNLFPREVPIVFNMFPRELIEGTPMNFLKANLRTHQRPDLIPKTRGSGRRCGRGFALGKSGGGPLINSLGNR